MRKAVVSLLALAVLATGAGVRADDAKAEARQHFEAGTALMRVEEFEAAAAEFQTSVDLYPTKNGLFNLANCLKATGRYQEALDAYDWLSREFEGALDEEMTGKMEADIEDIKALIARLSIQVDQPGATVRVDGRDMGTSPLAAPLVLGAGTHEVEVSLEGYVTADIEVKLLAGEHKTESVSLEVEPEPVEPEPADPETVVIVQPRTVEVTTEDDGPSGLLVGGAVTLSLGAALLVAGGATGGAALAKGSDLEDECPNGECPPSKHGEMDTMSNLALSSDILLGVGAAAAITGAILLVVDRSRRGDEEPAVEVTASPAFGPGASGLVLEGWF